MKNEFANDFGADLEILEKFLADKVSRGIIEAFRIAFFPSLKDLRLQWGHSDLSQISRTHKKVGSLQLGIEVIKAPGKRVGVDLETAVSVQRPIFAQIGFLVKRFRISERTRPQELLYEWVRREAAFKALHPENGNILLSEFSSEVLDGGRSQLTTRSGQQIAAEEIATSRLILALAWLE